MRMSRKFQEGKRSKFSNFQAYTENYFRQKRNNVVSYFDLGTIRQFFSRRAKTFSLSSQVYERSIIFRPNSNFSSRISIDRYAIRNKFTNYDTIREDNKQRSICPSESNRSQ